MHLAPPVLAWLDMPVAIGGGGAVTLALLIAYRLITDRTAVKAEIGGLVIQVEALTTKVDHLETLYDDERSLKHQAFNDVARALVALQVVRRLAEGCTCGALTSLGDIIDQVYAEMETAHRQRRPPHYRDAI